MSMRSRLLKDVVDPPTLDVVGGGNEGRAPVQPAVGGGIDGLFLPTLWEVLTDTTEEMATCSAMTELLRELEDSPRFRRGQVHGALGDIQAVLEATSHAATGSEKVELEVGTLVVLAHCLLRHQA